MILTNYLNYWDKNLEDINLLTVQGKVLRIVGFLIEGVGLHVPVGCICKMNGSKTILIEAIGFTQEKTIFIAFEDPVGILPGTTIEFVENVFKVPVGTQLKGRVINGFGLPIDNKGLLGTCSYQPVHNKMFNPFERQRINSQLDVGVRAINGLLSVGIGQRMGIFAGSGVGKSLLLGMITRFTKAEVVVVGLIGERGREIKEFLEENIGPDYLHKTVIIAAPINTSPLEKINGILTAVTVAEYFRDQGQNVLLIVDSLTRYAHALRKMYVLLGEPISSRGYPPSVFVKISQLAERCGTGNETRGGSITAFFTVLVEADDMNEPIADHVRSVLDGHIVLSRELAEATHFPAIDICKSVSRVMPNVVHKEHLQHALLFKKIYAHYLQNEALLKIGMYKAGTDQLLDRGIKLHHRFTQFLTQDVAEELTLEASINALQQVLKEE